MNVEPKPNTAENPTPTRMPDAIAYSINPRAGWTEAVAELRRMEGSKVVVRTAVNGICPSHVADSLGELHPLEFIGRGINEAIRAKVGEGELTVELRHFINAEVTAGYVAFVLAGVHLSITRWVPEVLV